MNLKYIYKAFDEFTDVQIFCEVESIEINGNPEDPVWIGKVMDIPHRFIENYKLDFPSDNSYKPVDLRNIINEHNVNIPTLFIILKRKNN